MHVLTDRPRDGRNFYNTSGAHNLSNRRVVDVKSICNIYNKEWRHHWWALSDQSIDYSIDKMASASMHGQPSEAVAGLLFLRL